MRPGKLMPRVVSIHQRVKKAAVDCDHLQRSPYFLASSSSKCNFTLEAMSDRPLWPLFLRANLHVVVRHRLAHDVAHTLAGGRGEVLDLLLGGFV
jgi:hypothetical protein